MKEIFTLQERNRISREIHDSVGHSLSTIIIQLGAISQLAKQQNSPIQEMSEGLRDFAVEGLQEVRKIVHDLKPEQMDKKQLDIALEEFFHEVQVNSGIDIQFRKMSRPSRSQVRQSSASSVGFKRRLQMRCDTDKQHALPYC